MITIRRVYFVNSLRMMNYPQRLALLTAVGFSLMLVTLADQYSNCSSEPYDYIKETLKARCASNKVDLQNKNWPDTFNYLRSSSRPVVVAGSFVRAVKTPPGFCLVAGRPKRGALCTDATTSLYLSEWKVTCVLKDPPLLGPIWPTVVVLSECPFNPNGYSAYSYVITGHGLSVDGSLDYCGDVHYRPDIHLPNILKIPTAQDFQKVVGLYTKVYSPKGVHSPICRTRRPTNGTVRSADLSVQSISLAILTLFVLTSIIRI